MSNARKHPAVPWPVPGISDHHARVARMPRPVQTSSLKRDSLSYTAACHKPASDGRPLAPAAAHLRTGPSTLPRARAYIRLSHAGRRGILPKISDYHARQAPWISDYHTRVRAFPPQNIRLSHAQYPTITRGWRQNIQLSHAQYPTITRGWGLRPPKYPTITRGSNPKLYLFQQIRRLPASLSL